MRIHIVTTPSVVMTAYVMRDIMVMENIGWVAQVCYYKQVNIILPCLLKQP